MKAPERRAGDGLPPAPHFKYPPLCAISSPPKARQFALWKQTRWVGGIKMKLWWGEAGGKRIGMGRNGEEFLDPSTQRGSKERHGGVTALVKTS